MQFATIRGFRDNATKMFRSHEAILVTNHGHVAGIYFPYPARTIPLDMKREMLGKLLASLGKKLKAPALKEEKEIIRKFLASRKNRR